MDDQFKTLIDEDDILEMGSSKQKLKQMRALIDNNLSPNRVGDVFPDGLED